MLKNLWIETKCWVYWLWNVFLIQFEAIGWWWNGKKEKKEAKAN